MGLPNELTLPDGQTVIMHAAPNYDPKKRREYYLRTRKLKGRKPAGAKPTDEKKPKVSAKQKAAYDKFLAKLPMSVEGASPADTEKFVNSLRGKSDAELQKAAADIKAKFGDKDGARVATINALLKNRSRIRKADPKTLNASERVGQRGRSSKAVTNLQDQLVKLNEKIKADPKGAPHLQAQLKSLQKRLSTAKVRQKALTPAAKK